MDWSTFSALLAKFAKKPAVDRSSALFRSDLDISSLAFLEFIMTLEEDAGIDIDVDDLDSSIETAGQLFDRIFGVA